MRVALLRTSLILLALLCESAAYAQKDPYVGDVAMSPKKTLLENLSASPIHTDFVKAIHATGMDASLAAGGPYTVFAPTNDAFAKTRVPGAVVPGGYAMTTLLKYHVVQGRLTSKRIAKAIKKGHGSLTLQTIAGEPLTVKRYGSVLVLTDAKGGTATLITPDVRGRDGTFDVIDAVLIPR